MRRRVMTFASLLSLLLCVATAVLWVRSYWRLDTWAVVNERWDTRNPRSVFSDFISCEIGCARGTMFLHAECGRVSYGTPAVIARRNGLHLWHRRYMYAYSYPEFVDRLSDGWNWHGISFLWWGDTPFTKPLGKGHGARFVASPAWMACLLLMFLPLTYIGRAIRNRSLRLPGLCPACGYNLTGNTSGVCPECGTAIK